MLCTGGAAIVSVPSMRPVRPCLPYTRCRYPVGFDSTISYGESAQELTSDGGTFELGFFKRGNNTYLGIWYDVEPTGQDEAVIVWVANRDSPMPKQSYELRIAKDGEAKVFDAKNHTYWSTTSSTRATNASSVFLQLSDDGNLQLVDRGRRGQTLWESFQNPTDTFLPGMDIGILMVGLTSWRNPQDPALGEYHFIKENTSNVLSMYNISSHSPTLYWDVPFTDLDPILTSLLYDNITVGSTLMRLVMNSSRSIQLWEYQMGWSIIWTAPTDQCDLSETCGSFGVCDAGNSFKCKCLPGFKPNDASKWESGDFSSGCSKRTYDQCGQTFLSLPMAKLPPNSDIPTTLNNESDCKELCLRACGSKAYSFDASQSLCRIWTNDLTRIQEEYTGSDAQTLHIRVNNSDIDSGPRSCNICGTNVIPYPLSTNQSCGDQDYVKFECNTSNGQVYFKPPSGKVYRVTLINPNSRTFSVRLPTTNTSKACIPANVKNKVFNLKDSSPFSVMNCSVVLLWDKQVVDVELSWKPPPPPACNSSVDCTQWAETTCVEDTDGKNVCTCAKGFHWDSLSLKCNEVNPKHTHMPLKLTAGIATACGIVLLLLGGFLVVVHLRRKRARQGAGLIDQFKTGDLEEIDIPFVDYQTILVVTENFSDANKLGAGGFGPVYKGKMADGSEVAVKRLSTTSVQGIEEFRNEVILIAKLQHRNLVRVVGYCMKEDEKILIYEYMPNKSLSSFIFDQTMSPLLDWTKRFNIILGIARGLVYLHQDSRLRIIHRDLKPSNILLDEELNPKISDFGLARIVAGNEMATTTARVVGTYGYMSPEYALDGYFSIKSDVYSFGIIVLEVISGRKCTSLFEVESSLISLLGYAWTLWNKGRALELVDKSIMDSCDSFQVERCINVGLLCLQEDPSARPTMSSILLMLGGGNTMSVPSPNQPVFVARRAPLGAASSSSGTSKFGTSKSHVEYTTSVEGR